MKSFPPRFNQCVQSSHSNGIGHLATSTDNERPEDVFLHYSNNETRMNHLLMLDEEGDPASSQANGSSPALQNQHVSSSSRYVQRRSILSFELHPDLIMADVLEKAYPEEGEDVSPSSDDSGGERSNAGDLQQPSNKEDDDKAETEDLSQLSTQMLLKKLLQL